MSASPDPCCPLHYVPSKHTVVIPGQVRFAPEPSGSSEVGPRPAPGAGVGPAPASLPPSFNPDDYESFAGDVRNLDSVLFNRIYLKYVNNKLSHT